MKTLIVPNIINKFIDTVSEEEYQKGWETLKDYQESFSSIEGIKEKELQSPFMERIFGQVLGYTSRSKNFKNQDFIVEKSSKGKFIDGTLMQDGIAKATVELKPATKDIFKCEKKQSGSLHSLPPIHQAAIYHFQEKTSELGIVSNFNDFVIFKDKQDLRQEFSLFDMNYDEFKEFYLIMNKESFYGGLTNLMIEQTEESDQVIDDEFFVKIAILHKQLHNKLKKEYADDLFNKFLALALLEDNGKLPANLINTIYNRKDDFDHSHSSLWEVFKDFFRNIKTNDKKREAMGILNEIAVLPVFQNVSYLGRIKVPKSILDLVLEISRYDLYSMKTDELFFNISRKIFDPYNLINPNEFSENAMTSFELYSEIMDAGNINGTIPTAGSQTLAFCTNYVLSKETALVELYNQISGNQIKIIDDDEDQSTLRIMCTEYDPKNDFFDEYFVTKEPIDLEDPDYIKEIKNSLASVYYSSHINDFEVVYLRFQKEPVDDFIFVTIDDISNKIPRKEINHRIIVLNNDDQSFVDEMEKSKLKLKDIAEVTTKEKATVGLEIDFGKVFFKDVGADVWYDDDLFFFEQLFLKPKEKYKDTLGFILSHPSITKYIALKDPFKKDFKNIPIPDEAFTEDFINRKKEEVKLDETISLYEMKLEKLQEGGLEIDILKCEQTLDKLYEKQTEQKN